MSSDTSSTEPQGRGQPEDPIRLHAFRSMVFDLPWSAEASLSSLSVLFKAVDDLAMEEVRYYYRRRRTRAWISGACRFAAWFLGSAGLLLPLLDRTGSAYFADGGDYGYGCFAGAASALAANSLFGGSDGHIRFVATQLELERLVTRSRIQWCAFIACPPHDNVAAFSMIEKYAATLHELTIAETSRWGEALLAELAKYRSSIDANKGEQK